MSHNLGLTQPNSTEPHKISFTATEIDVIEWKGDILLVGVTEKDLVKDESSKFENPILNKLDGHLSGLLAQVSSEEDFTGKPGQSTVLRLSGLGSKRIGLIGLGQSVSSPSSFHSLGEGVATVSKASQSVSAAIVLASSVSDESKLSSASALASGIVLGLFEDSRYKSESKKPSLKSVDVIGFGTGAEIEKKLKYAEDVSYGVIFGRELTNSPANVLTPAGLAAEAEKVASTYSDVFTANILNEEQCKELKMGSYLAVAAASANPPHFIHLVYKPSNGSVKTKLAIVGKGLTFDSGGYNIKTGPGCMIELMKFDMGGSAAVLGAAKAIGEIKPPGVEVHFIVAACENMISGTGMRPGDVITASNGKTIEVNNTDAEGRLTLADALVYACNQGVDKIVDLATLTGACVIALGSSMAGIYTPSDELAKEVIAASERSGEKLWRMPLEESYWEMMKSGVPWLTALCSFCCQIRFERISLRFASDSLLLCLSFTKFSWSSRTCIKKDLTSYVCWKVEPCNLNPFFWKSVMEFGVILAGVLILSDHLNGDSDLPCIEVLVRHVLILCVAKGFVPKISICVYVFVDAQWEVPPAEAPNPIPSPPQSATRCFVDAAWISNGNCGAALFAETLAMKLAFADAQTAGFHTLNVSSDCKALISLLNSGTSTVELRSLLHDIRELSVSFTSICFIFIPRLDNVCAVNLAKSTLLDVSSSSASRG